MADQLVPVDVVDDNPYQTRLAYDDAYIAELAADIARNGLLQKPVGRIVNGDGKPLGLNATTQNAYMDGGALEPGWRVQLAFGHNRLRALRLTEDAVVPVDLRPLDDEKMAELAWAENEQRRDLSPVEEARAIEKMIAAFGWTHDQVAERLGLARPTVSNKLRLLKLPNEVLEPLAAGEISERTARALIPVYDVPEELAPYVDKLPSWTATPERIVKSAIEGRDIDYMVKDYRRQLELVPENARQQEAQAAAHADAIALAKQQVAEATGKPVEEIDLPRLAEMGWDAYVTLHPDDVPTGCGEACTCRGFALGYHGDVVTICTDRKRFEALRAEDRKKAEEEQRAEMAVLVERLPEAIAAAGNLKAAAKALHPSVVRWIAGMGLDSSTDTGGIAHLEQACEAAGVDFGSLGLESDSWIEGRDLAAKLDPAAALRLALELELRSDVEAHVLRWRNYETSALLADLLGLESTAEEEDEDNGPADLPLIENNPVAASGADVAGASCRVCGCTDDDCSGCIERTGAPCSWAEPDLCSACADVPAETSADVAGPLAQNVAQWAERELEAGTAFATINAELEGINARTSRSLRSAVDRGADEEAATHRAVLAEIGRARQLVHNAVVAKHSPASETAKPKRSRKQAA